MSGFSSPVTRPTGRALIVGSQSCRAQPQATLQRLGFTVENVEEPFTAMRLLAVERNVYTSVIICLNSIFREELAFIDAVKRRYSQIEIWIAQSDGRAGALAEAMRLGADGLLADDGLHRTAIHTPAQPGSHERQFVDVSESQTVQNAESSNNSLAVSRSEDPPAQHDKLTEPLLTADELRALLSDGVDQ